MTPRFLFIEPQLHSHALWSCIPDVHTVQPNPTQRPAMLTALCGVIRYVRGLEL